MATALPEPSASLTTPDNPPWNIPEAIAVWFASVLLIIVVPAAFLLPYLAMQDPPITATEQIAEFAKSNPTAIILQMAAILPAHFLTLLLAWMVVTRIRRYSFTTSLGWRQNGFRWWHYCLILAAFFVAAMIVGAFFPEKENDLIRILRSSRSAVYIVAFVATVTAPLVEEVVYRGVLYSAFQRRVGVIAAFLVVTFLFALVHVPQYYPSYSTIFLLTVLSLTLTGIRVISGNLLPCIILHTLFNGLQSLLLILEPHINAIPSAETPALNALLHLLK